MKLVVREFGLEENFQRGPGGVLVIVFVLLFVAIKATRALLELLKK